MDPFVVVVIVVLSFVVEILPAQHKNGGCGWFT
jgi:hypothetical protein